MSDLPEPMSRRQGARRALSALVASLFAHGAALLAAFLALPASSGPCASAAPRAGLRQPADPNVESCPTPADADRSVTRARRHELRRAVKAGRMRLGDALIELEAAETNDRVRARRARLEYRALLSGVRERINERHEALRLAIANELREEGLEAYRDLNRRLTDALLGRGGNCQARTRLVTSLAYDAGFPERAYARVFDNHLAPALLDGEDEHHFGMVAACTGLGTRVAAIRLLDEALPASKDRCRDDRPLLGPPLGDDDPAPAWSGVEPPVEPHCPLALWPWQEPGDAVFLAPQPPAFARMPTRRLQPGRLVLRQLSVGLLCHHRQLRALRGRGACPHLRLPFLAKAVGYQREAAMAFAAAGELDIARAIESQQAETLAEARRLLTKASWHDVELRYEHWSFIYLGPAAHNVMFDLAKRERSWFASNMVAVLIREPATRERALVLLRSRTLPQQLEIADRVYWDEPDFIEALSSRANGRHVLSLRQAVGSTRRGWRTCKLGDLRRIAHRSVAESGLPPDYGPALVALLIENPLMHVDEHGCDAEMLARQLDRWKSHQSPATREWLGRSRLVAASPSP